MILVIVLVMLLLTVSAVALGISFAVVWLLATLWSLL